MFNCPWYYLNQKFPPNIDWCETMQCSWISEPANTWSNLTYIFLALVLFYHSKKEASKFLKLFPLVLFLMGLFSFIYHASNHYFSQMLDFLGMYLYVCGLIVINLYRLEKLSYSKLLKVYSLFVLVCITFTSIVFWFQFPIQALIGILALVVIGTEWVCYRKENKKYSLNWFILSILLLVIAGIFSALDVSRIWCEPNNTFLHGHSIWHVISGLGTSAVYFHYRIVFKKW